ncbi:MAG: YbhB/YbcL family Raf kinase inhibitor-like protein [Candidatus Berkelbacteria bacterium]|nr:YbhB/YbcL family Raf kinase inhibitor-like protein [Candidatus Berkelbacteria bacterium]
MKIYSPVFKNGSPIPAKYTCDGGDVIPPLKFEEIPEEAKSLAIIYQDPDSPNGDFVHWIIFDIGPQLAEIKEGEVPAGAIEGTNDFGNSNYGGPCPSSGSHRYVFKLHALDIKLGLTAQATKNEFRNALENHILAEAEVIGTYQRQ